MKLADPILISQIISSLGLTGQEAETKRQELEKLSNDELNKLIANISSFSPTSLGGFSALEKQNKFNGNVFQNNFVDNVSTSFSTTQNNQPKEYTRNQQKELDKFLGDFLYNSTSSGLQTITNYNDSIGILNITDRAVNGFKVLTGQQDRIGLQEQMTKEVEEAKKLQKAAYSQPGAFESKIERKFGIPYSHSNVEQLKTASEEFTRVSAYHDKVELLEQGFEEVKNILRQEQEYEQAKKYVRGAAAASLTPPEITSHQKFGEVLLQFCNGDKNVVNEYMKNLSSSMGSRAEIEKNLPQIMNELLTKCKEQEQEALLGKTFSQYEQEYNTACKKVFGTKDYKQTAQNFVNNAKTQAAYTEVGLTIATAILLPGSSTVKTGIQKAALKYGEKTAVQGFKAAMTFGTGSMPAVLSTLNAATSKEGFTPEKIEEIKEKFKNGLVYGGFGAYVSGPLGNAVEKVLSKNPTMLSNIVSKTMGTATETSADVLFDRITSDLSFTESLKQNGVMNFGMMIAGGRIAKGSDNSLSSLKVAKNNDGSYSVKDNTGKEVFKATDENALAGFVMAKGVNSSVEQVQTVTKEDAIEGIIQQLQHKSNVFEIREFLKYTKLSYGNLEFFDAKTKTKYFAKYNSDGEIIGYSTIDNKRSFNYYQYDKKGNPVEIDIADYNSLMKDYLPEISDNVLSNTAIPKDITKLILKHDYAFTEESINEMISLIKEPSDWDIVKKVLSTKGSTKMWKRTIGKAVGVLEPKFIASDLIAILKSDAAKQYVQNCIKHNNYCNKDKLNEIISMSGIATTKLNKQADLSYKTEDITLENTTNPINEFNTNPKIKEFLINKIPDGETANINGKLHCRSGNKLVELQISKETFEKLFPIAQRYNIKQGNIDDCWLISDVSGAISTPEGRLNLYSMFREENGNIFVKLPNHNIEVCFNHQQWKKLKTDGLNQAPDGIRMIEQTIAFNKRHNSETKAIKYADNTKEINLALKSLNGEQIGIGLSFLIPENMSKNCMFYNVVGNSYTKSPMQQKQDLEIVLTEINDFLQKNENAICPISFQRTFTIDGYTINGMHACRITGYNKQTKTVKIVNPHNGNLESGIPLDLFMHTAGMINLYEFTTAQKTYNFSAKRLNKDGVLDL